MLERKRKGKERREKGKERKEKGKEGNERKERKEKESSDLVRLDAEMSRKKGKLMSGMILRNSHTKKQNYIERNKRISIVFYFNSHILYKLTILCTSTGKLTFFICVGSLCRRHLIKACDE